MKINSQEKYRDQHLLNNKVSVYKIILSYDFITMHYIKKICLKFLLKSKAMQVFNCLLINIEKLLEVINLK